MDKKKVVYPSSVVDDIRGEGQQVSDFSKVCDLLLDNRYRRRKTILTSNKQVAIINTLDVIGQLFDIEFLKQWIIGFAEWRTSGDKGKGRQDIVDISKFKYAEDMKRNEQILNAMRGK